MDFKRLILFVLLGMTASCQTDTLVDQTISMPEHGWLQKNKVEIPFEIGDTTKSYDLHVAIRQSNEYPYYNLYFIPKIMNSDGFVIKRTFAEAFFYDSKTGKPKGTGLGDMYSHQYVIFKHIRFTRMGKYKISLEQFMRTDTLKGIVSAGASITETPTNDGKN